MPGKFLHSIILLLSLIKKFFRSVSPTPKSLDGRTRTRKPFHFKTTIHSQAGGCPSSPEAVPNDEAQEATYFRYKYYQRLRGNPSQPDEALVSLVTEGFTFLINMTIFSS